METFGSRLRRLRTQRSLSLDELAAKTGVSKAYLWRLETNPSVNPSLEIARKLADGLEIALGALVEGSVQDTTEGSELPPTLLKAGAQFDIPSEDLADLARIRFRGAQPMRAEDWGLLYLQLKKTLTEG